ncbi:formylglycine-generating enzyme family protein [Nitrospina gracilis]|uniref:formylglycine-generating enzyme family protein n=1 Tax=Nitrospina gracilis TaxID=35801 RepID=UPI001F2DB368|nr:SUMF1/EgtB/PvdO family nonheme iron enzyme [Nitrospina gracilis]
MNLRRQHIPGHRRPFWLCAMLLWLLAACTPPAPEGMVLIPDGYFSMGTDEVDEEGHALSLGLNKPWYADESPQHRVRLPAYYIDKYEVTNLQYYIFTQATDHRTPPGWNGPKYPKGRDHYPVTQVNFYDAAAYAKWAGKRLPTEMEWEKAARGPNVIDYPWGNQFDFSKANVSDSPRNKRGHGLEPIGQHPDGASPYGVEDMIGNVWEWIWDYYLPYSGNTETNLKFPKDVVVVRGLSYMGVGHFPEKEYKKVVALKSRVSYRENLHPILRKPDVGFRCVKEVPSTLEMLFGDWSSEPVSADNTNKP